MTTLITNSKSLGFGNITQYETTIGNFNVSRRNTNDYYGNPIYIIEPIGFIDSLPPVTGARRNNNKYHYSIQSYNIEDDFKHFLNRLNESLEKGHKLYVNPFKL